MSLTTKGNVDLTSATVNAGSLALNAGGDQAGMDAWKEGGIARAEMQAAGAAIVTGLAGGNAVGGAAGAVIASIAAGKLNELSGAIAGANPTGSADVNTALGNIVANAIATGAGGAIGGNAGAVSGYNVDRFNRQLHPEEKQKIAKQANGDKAEEKKLTQAACYAVKCWAEYGGRKRCRRVSQACEALDVRGIDRQLRN